MKKWNKHIIKSILISAAWIIAGCGTVVLLAAAVHRSKERECAGVNINISGVSNNFFIDKKDVQEIIDHNTGALLKGKAIQNFDLHAIETVLKKNVWIKNAELYFDNNNLLEVVVEEREPVARIFITSGASFYVDSSIMMLPLSEKFSARLPVFTGFPSDARVLSKPDSLLLKQVERISADIVKDPFLMGMIDQVDITAQRSFEMIPKIGNQLILLGDATDLEAKLDKLKVFYKNVIIKTGWGKYSVINLQYKNQVVAKIRGKDDVSEDSLRTKMLLQMIAETTERVTEDSVRASLPETEKNSDSAIIMTSIQRDEENDSPDFGKQGAVSGKQLAVSGKQLAVSSKPFVQYPLTAHSSPLTPEKHTLVPVKRNPPKALMPKH